MSMCTCESENLIEKQVVDKTATLVYVVTLEKLR